MAALSGLDVRLLGLWWTLFEVRQPLVPSVLLDVVLALFGFRILGRRMAVERQAVALQDLFDLGELRRSLLQG